MLALLASLALWPPVWAGTLERPAAQGTPTGPRVEVPGDPGFTNVRAGPGGEYEIVGRLVLGQTAPIIGKVTLTQFIWYKIEYFGGPGNVGWVSGNAATAVGDVASVPEIAAIDIPPTPTLPPTSTLELGSVLTATVSPAANRLPTFTPPAVIVRPTLLPEQGLTPGGGFPPALAIIILLLVGVFAGIAGLIRSRG